MVHLVAVIALREHSSLISGRVVRCLVFCLQLVNFMNLQDLIHIGSVSFEPTLPTFHLFLAS